MSDVLTLCGCDAWRVVVACGSIQVYIHTCIYMYMSCGQLLSVIKNLGYFQQKQIENCMYM